MTKLSRSGTTGPLGKKLSRLDIPMSEELEAAIITMATLNGVPKTEYARRILERFLFGEFPMVKKIAVSRGNDNGMSVGYSADGHDR